MSLDDNNAARTAVFARIARARADEKASQPAERGSTAPFETDDHVEQFRLRAIAMQATAERVSRPHGSVTLVPERVAAYVDEHGLVRSGCVSPLLDGYAWREAGLNLEARAAKEDDAIGVSAVFAAIAETGTLVLVSGPDTPSTVSLLPPTHIALVSSKRIVARMEDAWRLLREEMGELPRAVNFVSGPSRTADIDQQIVLGVHGPSRVHILILED